MKKIENSPITIGDDNKFKGDTIIGHGSKIEKIEIHEGSKAIEYEVAPPYIRIIEALSKVLIFTVGETKSKFLDILALLGALFGIPIGFNSLLNTPANQFTNSTPIGLLPKFPQYAMIIIVLGFLSFFAFVMLFEALNYYPKVKCENCGQDFALREIKPRKRRDVDAVDAVYRSEIHYTECRYCHDRKEANYYSKIGRDHENDD